MLRCDLRYDDEVREARVAGSREAGLPAAECREENRAAQPQLEAQQRMAVAAKNRDAVHCVAVRIGAIRAVLYGEGGPVAGGFCRGHDIGVIGAAWIGEKMYRRFQVPLDGGLGILQLMEYFIVGGELVEIVIV